MSGHAGIRTLLGILAGLAAACHEAVFEPVANGLVATARLSGDVTVVTRADVVFVVDDSPSMANEQAKLAAGAAAFFGALDALDPPVDWRVGILTTSVEERFGPCVPASPGAGAACSAAFGGAGFSCDAGACVRGFPALAGRFVAAPGNPELLARAALPANEILRVFSENVQVGTGGSRHEQPLRALGIGLAGALLPFVRPDARLVVLVASDEDDCSDSTGRFVALEQRGDTYVDHCAEESIRDTGALDGVTAFAASLRALVTSGRTRGVSVGAIVGLADGTQEPGDCTDPACAAACRSPANEQACDTACTGSLRPATCRAECLDECVSFCGSQSPGWRTARLVREFGGPLASICQSDYGPSLARLARVLGIPDRLELPSTPKDRRALFLTVNRAGRRLECVEGRDFTLDLAAVPPAIDLVPSGACRLIPGDHWEVEYIASDR